MHGTVICQTINLCVSESAGGEQCIQRIHGSQGWETVILVFPRMRNDYPPTLLQRASADAQMGFRIWRFIVATIPQSGQ